MAKLKKNLCHLKIIEKKAQMNWCYTGIVFTYMFQPNSSNQVCRFVWKL